VDGTSPTLNMSFSRLSGNTATGGGSNLSQAAGTATVKNNWWGDNTATTTLERLGGTTTFDPFIVLTLSAASNNIRINTTDLLTGDVAHDNHGSTATLAGNLDVFNGLPVTFGNTVGGSITTAQPVNLSASGSATSVFQAGSSAANGSAGVTF